MIDILFVLKNRQDYLVEFDEPLPGLSPTGEERTVCRTVRMSVDDAIAASRYNSEGRGLGCYPDYDHLHDFITTNHAHFVAK